MKQQKALPHLTEPHDSLRLGVHTLKDRASVNHPVEAIEEQFPEKQEAFKMQMLKNLYGSALPARMQLDKQILSKVGRLPGIPSSQLGLQSYTGELDDFGVESFIGFPGEEEVPGPDMHSVMEAQLEMGTKPLKRTIF